MLKASVTTFSRLLNIKPGKDFQSTKGWAVPFRLSHQLGTVQSCTAPRWALETGCLQGAECHVAFPSTQGKVQTATPLLTPPSSCMAPPTHPSLSPLGYGRSNPVLSEFRGSDSAWPLCMMYRGSGADPYSFPLILCTCVQARKNLVLNYLVWNNLQRIKKVYIIFGNQ